MTTVTKYILYFAIAVLLVAFSFIGGCQYRKKTFVCPEPVSDTIYRYDTTWVYINQRDTVYLRQDTVIVTEVIPADIDTAAIIQKFYNKYGYVWEQKDSAIIINGYTTVTQNRILSNELKYKWLLPQQTIINKIDNSVYYTSYITLGLSLPINNLEYSSLNANYNWRRGYLGVGYMPQLNSFQVNIGVTLFKFK